MGPGERRPYGSRRRGLLAVIALLGVSVGIALIVTGGGRRRHPSRAPPTSTPVFPTPPAPATSTPTSPTPPAPPSPARKAFGASVNRLFNDRAYTPTQIAAQLRALRATGATIARSDALWEAIEPTPPVRGVHSYDWGFDDSIAGSLAAQELQWLPIIDYSPSWAQSTPGQEHSPPRSATDYSAFAAALAARYGPNGSFWSTHPNLTAEPVRAYEIWNEPDNPTFWRPATDAAGYADLYVQARNAIKAVDPAARVIVGGLTNSATFLPAMLQARPDLRGQIDGVGIHPYGPTPQAVLEKVSAARRTLLSLGLGDVPLYVTEFGWTTSPPGALSWLPERLRPGYISATLVALGHLDCGVAAVVLYTWVTPERDPSNAQDWFGIRPPGGGRSRDSAGFAAGLRGATRPGPAIRICASG